MGCARHSRAPLRIRVRASFCTAFGVGAVLLVVCVVSEQLQHTAGGVEASVARRLEAVEEEKSMYPNDLILKKPYGQDPNRWLVILHCIGIMYMLLGLNTVCDEYFTGALEIMVERWQIKPDVAGATFMAAGGSAPELFTSLVGATIAISDVGFSTIVGSAVFNVLFVIGLCGYCAKEDMQLTWWPLFRDCTYYIIGLLVLTICAWDERIGLGEAIGLFCAYLVYCTIMYHNPRIEALVDSRVRRAKKQVAPVDTYSCSVNGSPTASDAIAAGSPSTYGKMMDDLDDMDNSMGLEGKMCLRNASTVTGATSDTTVPKPTPSEDITSGSEESRKAQDIPAACEEGKVAEDEKIGGSKAEEEEEEDELFINMPEGNRDRVIWLLSLPVYVPLYVGCPLPSERWFVATFLISLLWIAGFAFLLVWWTDILGQVLRIDEIIMGFTLLAAGTSIPDAVSSVAVARAGQGDMAVSSSIGSNIFDILVGLPIPWTIKILIDGGNSQVRIYSPYLPFYVILLTFMVACVVVCIHFLGWKLNKALGAAMAVLYAVFLLIALLVELLPRAPCCTTAFDWLKFG